jgi:hypothetical protein
MPCRRPTVRLVGGRVIIEPFRIGILGATRISDLWIIEPAHQLGHRLLRLGPATGSGPNCTR